MSESKRQGRVGAHRAEHRSTPKHYQGWDGALQGCENDARDMEAIAKAAGFERHDPAHQSGHRRRRDRGDLGRGQEGRAGDLFLLTYSGHGSQVPDKNGDEPDQLDETWVLYDRQLVDDELYSLWAKFRPGVRIFVLSDSCHSGSAVRATLDAVRPEALEGAMTVPPPNGMRAMPRAVADEVYEANQKTYDEIQAAVPRG